MPYLCEKKRIPRELDRRVKLTDKKREELLKMKGQLSQRQAARKYNISKRLVQFVWDEGQQERAKELYKERRLDGRYYNKEKNTKAMRKHRQYKHSIEELLNG